MNTPGDTLQGETVLLRDPEPSPRRRRIRFVIETAILIAGVAIALSLYNPFVGLGLWPR